VHQNGLLAAAGGSDLAFPGAADSADLGWAGILTVDSTDAKFERRRRRPRQHPDRGRRHALTDRSNGITPQIAHAQWWRIAGSTSFQSIADLLDVTPAQNQGRTKFGRRGRFGSIGKPGGERRSVHGHRRRRDGGRPTRALSGAININTAGLDVLVCLPGVTPRTGAGHHLAPAVRMDFSRTPASC
jgi:hypothetical protein